MNVMPQPLYAAYSATVKWLRGPGAVIGTGDELISHELKDVDDRRVGGVAGIALSGGGIRSATYCLGVLQSLDRFGLLRHFDYLSTVSGGGYVGSFWSAWRKNNDADTFPRSYNQEEHPAIRHLRQFSNFLSPRMNVFSFDTGRMVVAPLASTIPAFATAISGLIILFLAWAGLASLLLATTLTVSLFTFLLVISLFVFATEIVWMQKEGREDQLDWTYSLIGVATIAIGLALWRPTRISVMAALQWPWVADLSLQSDAVANDVFSRTPYIISALYYPATVAGILILGVIAVRALLSRWLRVPERMAARSAFDRLLSRIVLLFALWWVVATLWLAGTLLLLTIQPGRNAGLLSVLTSALTIVFVSVRRFMSMRPNAGGNARLGARVKSMSVKILAWATVVMISLMIVISLQYAHAVEVAYPIAGTSPTTILWLGSILIVLLAIVFFHPNRLSLHAFYRGRLARAYLGASLKAETPVGTYTEEQPGDDFRLNQMRTTRPLHLLCCAANNLAPRNPLSELRRGAVSAVLSPVGFSVGSKWRLWSNEETPTLGAAMTASGAAFNSLMGPYSQRFGLGAVFLMASLNLRLGLWLRHPHSHATSTKDWRLPGLLFLRELVAYAQADGGSVHLSDGGHFDNTAAYELIRRRCRFLLVCDCGADPDFNFDDMGNLIRKVREDFGAEIKIDLSPLRPVDGFSRQPMVAGDIQYSDGSTGVLLVLKPTLVGSEPADVMQYKKRNPDFPAETTGDQFYDEAQWESYRRLGEFAADTAFGFANDTDIRGGLTTQRLQKVFARARFDWLPTPPDRDQRIAQLAQRSGELERLLADIQAGRFVGEVFKELGDFNGQPLQPAVAYPQADSVATLQLARRALSFLEEVYYGWQLETCHTQPQNLGAVNYFARWAYAPMVREWWPVLKSMCSPAFIRFMQDEYGLPATDPGARDPAWQPIGRIAPNDMGFALYCWSAAPHKPHAARNETLLEYRMRLSGAQQKAQTVQAGLLRCYEDDGTVTWRADDFFVPAGLWGIGIGERFLTELLRQGRTPFQKVTRFRVLMPRPDRNDPMASKVSADATQLYLNAGFRRESCDETVAENFGLSEPICLEREPW